MFFLPQNTNIIVGKVDATIRLRLDNVSAITVDNVILFS